MRISLGTLRRIIREEVTRISEAQGELDLGSLGVSRSHRHALAPEPPPGFIMDTEVGGGGHGVVRTGGAYGRHETTEHSASNPKTGEVVVWDGSEWVSRRKGSPSPYSGGYSDHSMDHAVGGRSIGDDWRSSRYGGSY